MSLLNKRVWQLAALQESYLQLKTDLNELSQVIVWFDGLHQPQIGKSIWLRCQLALAEAFTNAVRHAHKNKSAEVPIDIKLTIFDNYLEIRVFDYGIPFNLEAKLREMPKKEDNISGGGRGLLLMDDIADRLSYTRTEDNRNCLLMVKYYG